jgi:hypothetical protein
VFIGTDAHSPRHWPASLVQFINTRGQDKCLFGTDWPVVEFERAMREIAELPLREGPRQKLLFDNAVRVYKLERWI